MKPKTIRVQGESKKRYQYSFNKQGGPKKLPDVKGAMGKDSNKNHTFSSDSEEHAVNLFRHKLQLPPIKQIAPLHDTYGQKTVGALVDNSKIGHKKSSNPVYHTGSYLVSNMSNLSISGKRVSNFAN